jgi:hypothetical protein
MGVYWTNTNTNHWQNLNLSVVPYLGSESFLSNLKFFPQEKFLRKKSNKMSEFVHGKNSEYIPRYFPVKFPYEFFLGVLLWIFRGINFSDIFMETFRHILGKIPRNCSMLTPRIFCFTKDGSTEELT